MAGPRFHLDVTTEPDDAVVRLRLRDDDGRHLAGHAVRLAEHSPALWEGLFDTRAHVARYAGGTRFTAEPATPEDLLARLGVFLGRDVLGSELTALLHKGIERRTLVVRLPATDDATAIDENLAAAFARVPWEIARPDADAPPLMHRNLAVRTILADAEDGQRSRGGEPVPEAPDPVVLGRALVSALDIAEDANRALERWQACLDLLEEIEETDRTLGEGKHERARTRFNQYGPLLRLGRLDDAQRVLEGCLDVFREVDDVTAQATVLSSLADLWDKRGDRVQAVALARQALAVRNRLPDLAGRSISHGNLSNYLDDSGETEEAARHLLAAIVYDLVTNRQQGLSIKLNNLAICMRRAAPAPYELPRLADLLSRPELAALQQVLDASGVDAEGLQGAIDQRVEQVRQ